MSDKNASLAIHLSALLFGLTGILGQVIQASPVFITAGRAVFAAAALALFIRLQGQKLSRGLGPRHRAVIGAAGAMLATHWITFFIAVKISGVAIATLGFASFPAFITLCERVLERARTIANPAQHEIKGVEALRVAIADHASGQFDKGFGNRESGNSRR